MNLLLQILTKKSWKELEETDKRVNLSLWMNFNGNWVLQIDESVHKFLSRIPRKDARRIISVISGLPKNPFLGDIQKMKGEENVWRRRTGSYRIRYELITKERVIHVFLVERRTSNTY